MWVVLPEKASREFERRGALCADAVVREVEHSQAGREREPRDTLVADAVLREVERRQADELADRRRQLAHLLAAGHAERRQLGERADLVGQRREAQRDALRGGDEAVAAREGGIAAEVKEDMLSRIVKCFVRASARAVLRRDPAARRRRDGRRQPGRLVRDRGRPPGARPSRLARPWRSRYASRRRQSSRVMGCRLFGFTK